MTTSPIVTAALNRSSLTMSSREIADLTGKEHQHVRRDIRAMMESLKLDVSNFGRIYFDSMNREQTEYLLDQDLTMTLVMGYSTELRYKVAVRWRELEQGIASPILSPKNHESIHAELLLAETAARMLNISSSGKLGMLKTIQSIHGLPNILPSYAIDAPSDAVDGSSRPTFSATELLRRFDVSISAKAFNVLLENNGLIKRATRPSTKAPEKQKEFWVITGKGLMYGKNVVDHRCPRETQPHWFESRFNELLKTVGLSGKAAA